MYRCRSPVQDRQDGARYLTATSGCDRKPTKSPPDARVLGVASEAPVASFVGHGGRRRTHTHLRRSRFIEPDP